MAQVNDLRICWGVRRGKRLVCKEPVTDEAVIKEVLELVDELRRRVEVHRGKLGTAAFIGELINLLERWLEEHKNDKGKKIKEAKKIAKKMIKLLRKLKKKWVEKYWKRLLELMEMLEKNATDIIVTGGNDSNRSLTVHLYNEDIAVIVSKVAKSGSITISLSLSKLEGDDVRVTNTFSDEEALKAIQRGWEITDGGIMNGHSAMGTSQPWQVVLWSLAYPGKIHMYINSININGDGASIMWHLIAKDHKAKPKKVVAKEVRNFDEEKLRVFLAPAVWGDGDVNVGERYVKLIIGLAKYELWLGIIERLVNELGFTMKIRDYKAEVGINSSNAVRLARDWLSVQDIKELIELGASLPGGEKLKRIIELANMEIKELGSSSITIPGTDIRMTICIDGQCRVELRARRKSKDEALWIIEELRRAGCESSLRVAGRYYEVAILHSEIQSKPELREPVCNRLLEWYEELPSDSIEEKWRFANAMRKLGCTDVGK
ncbi:MAG: hypothetical protein ACP5L5_02275 [Vulcanisaeta sp.]|uniref:hypothetical protein n=1 Tax=Vulcanisaeta sp. TaxID=2020871 RepID=UPI003D146569